MAITKETLAKVQSLRITVNSAADATTRRLIVAWSKAWAGVREEWEASVAELAAMNADGVWPTNTQIVHNRRAQAALEATYEALVQLGDRAGVVIGEGLPGATATANGWVPIIASQYPPQAIASAAGSLIRADKNQIAAIVDRTQGRVTKTLFPLAGDSHDIIRRTLIRGVAQGLNPRVAARQMVRGIRAGFDKALERAMVVARTEMLDAHRAGSLVVRSANMDVLGGWVWHSALDRRTCPACFSRHGTEYPADTPGPDDHPQGRCVGIPKTKSWADLGFPDIVEPPSLLPSADDVFYSLPRADQVAIMGPGRMALLDSGDVSLADLGRMRSNSGWRDSLSIIPVKDLLPPR